MTDLQKLKVRIVRSLINKPKLVVEIQVEEMLSGISAEGIERTLVSLERDGVVDSDYVESLKTFRYFIKPDQLKIIQLAMLGRLKLS